jgi:hypothetical protein
MTQELAKELFIYKDGILIWRKNNKKAGYLDKSNGYIRIRYKDGFYYSHRLIFLMHYGYFPKYIDHINGNKTNNLIDNLRECTQQENCFNSKVKKNNKLGYKGISIHKKSGLYRAVTYFNSKQKQIGYFKILEDAINAYNNAVIIYHGNFAKLNKK